MIGATINRICLGISLEVRKVNESEIDYSHYLGPDYKSQKKSPGTVPTIISPHISTNDIPLLMMAFGGNISFVAGEFMLKIPLYGAMCKRLGCVFVPRAGNAE